MNFKILSLTIVVAASLAALASMPLTTTPAYAGGNVKVSNTNHVHNNDGDVGDNTQSNECIANEITGNCNTTTVNNPPKEECKPNPNSNPPKVCPP